MIKALTAAAQLKSHAMSRPGGVLCKYQHDKLYHAMPAEQHTSQHLTTPQLTGVVTTSPLPQHDAGQQQARNTMQSNQYSLN
jgi:hypothetical protein